MLLAQKKLRPHTLRARLISTSLVLMAVVLTVATLFPSGASAAIGFRAASSGNNTTGATTLSIAMPTGTVAQDVMVAVISARGGTGVVTTAPSGWTQIQTSTSGTTIRSSIFYKVAASGEAGPYVFSLSVSNKASGVISSYSGVDTQTPVNTTSTQAYSSGTVLNSPTVTTTVPNTWIISGFTTATGTTVTPGSSMTERGENASTGGSVGTRTTTQLQDILQASAGASGFKVATAGAAAVSIGHTVALTPKLDMKMSAYRWYQNADSTTPGTALASQNTAASMGAGTARLQILAHIQDGKTSPHRGVELKYAQRGADNVCDASGTNETYQSISSRAKTKATFGSTATNDTGYGSQAWSSPSSGLEPGVSSTGVNLFSGSPNSNYLKLTGFGFSIPGGATIHSVTVTASASATAYSEEEYIHLYAHAVKGGTIQSGSESQIMTSTDPGYSLRLPASFYGTSFSAADINSSTFGVAIRATGVGLTIPVTAYVDAVNIQVTYSNGGTLKTVDNSAPLDGAASVDGGLTHGADNIYSAAYSESSVANFAPGSTQYLSGDMLFDFALDFSTMSPGVYCLMAFRDDGTALGATHDVVPQMTILPPTVTQANYRWLANANSATPGAPLVAQDTAATVAVETPVRLRQRLAVDTASLSASAQNYKLQYAEKSGVCDVGFSGETYTDVYVPGSTFSVSTAGVSRTAAQVDNPAGVRSWGTISNAVSSDNAYATASYGGPVDGFEETEYLVVGGDMPTIPANATITGIRLGYKGAYGGDASFAATLALDGVLKTAEEYPTLSTMESLFYWGGSTDLWGTTWTAAEINSATSFQVYMRGDLYYSAVYGSGYLAMDTAFIEVYYNVPDSTPLLYYNNASPADNTTISSVAGDPTNGARPTVYQKYRETDPFTNSVAAIPSGSDGMWDFALTGDPSAAGKTYCLRVVKSNDDLLDTYSYIPEISFTSPDSGPTLDQQLRGGQSMQNGVKTPLNW